MPFQEDGKMDISETRMERAIREFIEGADADAIAYIAGCMFGGDCTVYWKEDSYDGKHVMTYDFQPNENYGGEFDYIK